MRLVPALRMLFDVFLFGRTTAEEDACADEDGPGDADRFLVVVGRERPFFFLKNGTLSTVVMVKER